MSIKQIENIPQSSEDVKPASSLSSLKWKIGQKYWKVRKTIGNKIIGNPRYGKGILLQIPICDMTDGQKESYWEAEKLLWKSGIGCDTGFGGRRDLEWDWSLKGAIAKCKRCGNSTIDQVKEYHKEKEEEHKGKNKDNCGCHICSEPERHKRCMEKGY